MKIVLAFLICCTSNASLAQAIVTADEFEKISLGKTLYFGRDGIHYGAEQFFQNRQSVWRSAAGTCINGRWDEVGDGICFVYEDDPTPHCWVLTRENSTITIKSMFVTDGDTQLVLEIVGQDTVPISCEGPIFGV